MKILDKDNPSRYLTRKIKVFIIIPLIAFSTLYLSVGIYILGDISSFNRNLEKYYWWDNEECKYEFKGFYKNDVNWTFLNERAKIYENWTHNYCIARPEWNCSTTHISTNFKHGIASPFTNYSLYQEQVDDFLNNKNSKFRDIRYQIPFGDYGDSVKWTGTYIAELGFHYAVACKENKPDEANQILEKLLKPIEGLHITTHVTGIDGNLARFAVKDTPENRKRMLDVFYRPQEDGTYKKDEDYEREFGFEDNRWPGQGKWEDWWYVDDTSRDMHFGLFLGYGIVYKLLSETNAPDGVNKDTKAKILKQIKSDGTDVLDCLIGSNWQVLSGEEDPEKGRGANGASFLPRIPWSSGGDFMMGALAFGRMVNSDKYESFFTEAVNRFMSTSHHYAENQAQSYFGNCLAFDNLFLAWFLSENQGLKDYIRWHYNNDFYAHVRYHRNVLFNLGYFIVNNYDLKDDVLEEEKLNYILDDITENMDTFARWKFPVRQWHIPRPDNYDKILDKKNEYFRKTFAEDSTHLLNYLYGWIFREAVSFMPRSKYALGVNSMPPSNFVWQRSSFHIEGFEADKPSHTGDKQMGGTGFTLPYWMACYYGYFQTE
jgi:hypothetical protein